MFAISEVKKKQGFYCCAYACKNKPVKKKGALCHKHYARKLRENDPIGVRYNQMKQKAKQRCKQFNITLKEFREFCAQTGYLVKKGNRGFNATIDRIDNRKGYSIDNIQLLTLRQNSAKGDKINYDVGEVPF